MPDPSWPAAVLWDMDGTLVDTEPYWIASEFALAERYGGTWSTEQALNLVGLDLLDSGRYISEHMGIDLEPSEIVEHLLDGVMARIAEEVPWRPGARELLADLGEAGIPRALVTMSYRRFVAPVLDTLHPGTFDVVVTGDAVSRGKPHRSRTSRQRASCASTLHSAWRSRTPTPAPGRPRPPAAWCS